MVKVFKIHKYSGLIAGVVLFILGVTGFFLDHKNWSFMYTISFEHFPTSIYAHEKKLVEAYWVDPKDEEHIVVGSRRGIFEKRESDDDFVQTSSLQCLSLRSDGKYLYAATNDGLYRLKNGRWTAFALQGEFINALSIYDNKILVSIDKKELVVLQKLNGIILDKSQVLIDKKQLQQEIKLSRFVRDLHYGRGLFDGISSLLINDYGALFLVFLSFSGYLIWLLIKKKKTKLSRPLIKLHANPFVILALFPFFILLVTGIFLDHANLLGSFMRSVKISPSILPPVYSSLTEDIWSVNLDKNSYKIGNRYGVYESSDLKNWTLVSRGFAYRMKKEKDTLYVSGMGAPNRVFKEGAWHILPKTPHMFKDINIIDDEPEFLSHKSTVELPEVTSMSLYSLLLSLHDGTFFSSWWVWINDIASILLFTLGVTGTLRYLKRKRVI